jgi:hypothetical protein
MYKRIRLSVSIKWCQTKKKRFSQAAARTVDLRAGLYSRIVHAQAAELLPKVMVGQHSSITMENGTLLLCVEFRGYFATVALGLHWRDALYYVLILVFARAATKTVLVKVKDTSTRYSTSYSFYSTNSTCFISNFHLPSSF